MPDPEASSTTTHKHIDERNTCQRVKHSTMGERGVFPTLVIKVPTYEGPPLFSNDPAHIVRAAVACIGLVGITFFLLDLH